MKIKRQNPCHCCSIVVVRVAEMVLRKRDLSPLATNLHSCFQIFPRYVIFPPKQLQIQRTSSVRPSKISKIFLTHSHGDHSFGLPGLLCLMGQDRGDRATSIPIDIYGPEGIRMWLRVAIRYSVSRIVPNYRVHELKDIPMAPEWDYCRRHGRAFYNGFRDQQDQQQKSLTWGIPNNNDQDSSSWTSQYHRMPLEASPLYGEIEGGRDIYPHYDHPLSAHGAPIWEVDSVGGDNNDDIRVYAAPMSHGIPCVGYAIHESNRPGRLRDDIVRPICQRNVQALKEAGFVHPLKAMAVIKNLAPGTAFTFPDGTVVRQEDAVEPPRRGRKVVICGDTSSSRAMEGLAKDADIIVHEATNTFLYGLDKDGDMRSVRRDAMIHGHSTPQLAGEFCKRVGAKRLILNHFSARYKGDPSIEAVSIMTRIEDQAIKASGLDRADVAAAWDFMIYPIPASTESVQHLS
jgi:ribonuclease Z